MAMAAMAEQQYEIFLPRNGKSHHRSPARKLENGWQEALIAESYKNGGATISLSSFFNGLLEHDPAPPPAPPSSTKPVAAPPEIAHRGKVCVLSIDGGGMRGIIPAKLLAHLERLLQLKTGDPGARIVDFFDIAAGSNVGGMIAAMLFTGKGDANRPLFTAQEAWNVIAQSGRAIFQRRIEDSKQQQKQISHSTPPPKKGFLRKLFSRKKPSLESSRSGSDSLIPRGTSSSSAVPRGTGSSPEVLRCSAPKFLTAGLDAVLRDTVADRTLRDTLKPVLVPCYDLATSAPFLFSRADALDSPAWDFRLADVCRAASATPGMFPAASVASVDGTTRCTAVDAGMVMNNPAAAAMTHVLHNVKEFPKVRDAGDVLLLSLGSGVYERRYDAGVADWGPCQWARPAAEIVLENVSEMVDKMLAIAYDGHCRENYLRLQTVMPGSECPADDPSESNVERLSSMADELLKQNAMELTGFRVTRPLQKTNAERLDWFADQLIEEQRARQQRSSPTVLLKMPKSH